MGGEESWGDPHASLGFRTVQGVRGDVAYDLKVLVNSPTQVYPLEVNSHHPGDQTLARCSDTRAPGPS